MKVTQVTHNDLDGYGASTIVGNLVAVDRVEHVVRYADVEPVLAAEVRRLAAAPDPEVLLVSDIAVEAGFAALLAGFSTENAARTEPHRLLVIDHHASSIQNLERAGFVPEVGAQPPRWHLGEGGSLVTAYVDVTRSATRLCADLAPMLLDLGDRPEPIMQHDSAEALADAVDAIDLWKRDDEAFDAGEAVNELFWEMVLTCIPPGHEAHDPFMARILSGAAFLLADGCQAAEIEAAAPELRREAVDWILARSGLAETPRQRAMTTRMRLSRLLARSDALFAEPFEGMRIKVAHALDPGIMQRTSDFLLDEGEADVVVNVMRGGAMSFRSRDGGALALAERFGGGGHPASAGARLPSSAVFSLDEAVRQMREVLAPAQGPGPAA